MGKEDTADKKQAKLTIHAIFLQDGEGNLRSAYSGNAYSFGKTEEAVQDLLDKVKCKRGRFKIEKSSLYPNTVSLSYHSDASSWAAKKGTCIVIADDTTKSGGKSADIEAILNKSKGMLIKNILEPWRDLMNVIEDPTKYLKTWLCKSATADEIERLKKEDLGRFVDAEMALFSAKMMPSNNIFCQMFNSIFGFFICQDTPTHPDMSDKSASTTRAAL